MPNPVVLVAGKLASIVSAVGSLFIKRDSEGKLNVALAPVSIVIVLATGVTCSVQKSEPFSVCVRGTAESLKELIYAN